MPVPPGFKVAPDEDLIWRTWSPDGAASMVTSVFGRIGAVVAAFGDYLASQIANNSGVPGASVKDALDALAAASAPVASVFGRIGAVVATAGDYAATQIANDSIIAGANVAAALNLCGSLANSALSQLAALTSDDVANTSGVAGADVTSALNALDAAIVPAPVSSVFGRLGAVVAAANDYAASQVQNDSSVAGADVKAALNALLAAIPTLTEQKIWLPDVFPLVPHALDQEGTNTVGLGTWDPAAAGVAVSAANSQIRVLQPSQAADSFCGAYVTGGIPAGNEWFVATKVSVHGGLQRFLQAGLALCEDIVTNPTTASFVGGAVVMGNNTDGGFKQAWKWTRYNLSSVVYRNTTPVAFASAVYVRIRVNMTGGGPGVITYDVDLSWNGIDWVPWSGTQTFTGTPRYVAAVVDNANTGNTVGADFDFIRFGEGAGYSTFSGCPPLGALVNALH